MEDNNNKNEITPGNLKLHYEDLINHPPHYIKGKYEPIDVIEDWELNFNLGNVIKYIARAPYKENRLNDLKKARFYLNREITRLEADEI